MKISFKILEKQEEIQRGILKGFLPEISKDFNAGVSRIKAQLPELVSSIVKNSEEYYSLIGGALKYELGIPDSDSKIASMINIWTSNIKYEYQKPKIQSFTIKANFSAALFKADFSDILGTEYAKVYDRLRGYELPWLEWLVLNGNAPLISNYEVEYGASPRSRTGGALMVTGKSWSVPTQFAGTVSDNWITRSIQDHSSDIEKLVERSFR